MAVLSNVSYLYRKPNGTATFSKLCDITSVPDLGGAPEQIDITTLSDRKQKNMNGIQTVSSHEFSAWYDSEIYDTLQSIMEADYDKTSASELDTYQVWIGDDGVGGKFEWQGKLSVYVGGYESNAAIPMTITISDEGEQAIKKVESVSG
ncbi:MAG: phage tail protein [Bacteroidota bacterium]|nr:phage tail protein [Bacteroidota bacterium]